MDQVKAYPPIEDYGLIGNCYTAALISSRGSLDWLCMPCFDSPSVFAGILDAERGGSWSIHPTASCRAEHRYLEYTNVLETIFVCEEGRVRLLDFMPVSPEGAGGGVPRRLPRSASSRVWTAKPRSKAFAGRDPITASRSPLSKPRARGQRSIATP